LNPRQSPKRSQSYDIPVQDNFSEATRAFTQRKSEELVLVKTSKIDETILLQKAINILALYNVSLALETNQEDNQINGVLKHLIPEFGFFPQSFIQRINLKKFVICNEEDLSAMKRKYSSTNVAFFPLSLQTSEAVFKTLYKVIYEKIVMTRTQITEEWENIEDEASSESTELSFEEVFMAVMQNINLAPLRNKTEKAKELLIKHFSSDFDAEWFINRNKEKKRGYKVQFCDDMETIIP
jgi:hypothetical protein